MSFLNAQQSYLVFTVNPTAFNNRETQSVDYIASFVKCDNLCISDLPMEILDGEVAVCLSSHGSKIGAVIELTFQGCGDH